MQSLPIKVKNVTIYAYFNPTEPLSEVVLENASGVYSIGTLGLNSFYNLNLDNEGKKVNPLNIHSKYYATGENENGDKFTTPWMYCLSDSDKPEFGRTISMGSTGNVHPEVSTGDDSGYIQLGKLTDITVSEQLMPPAIGERIFIRNGSGNIIATKFGTPHEMGVQVDSGERTSVIPVGTRNIMISGKTEKGTTFSQSGMTVISNGKPAIFLHEFYQK